ERRRPFYARRFELRHRVLGVCPRVRRGHPRDIRRDSPRAPTGRPVRLLLGLADFRDHPRRHPRPEEELLRPEPHRLHGPEWHRGRLSPHVWRLAPRADGGRLGRDGHPRAGAPSEGEHICRRVSPREDPDDPGDDHLAGSTTKGTGTLRAKNVDGLTWEALNPGMPMSPWDLHEIHLH